MCSRKNHCVEKKENWWSLILSCGETLKLMSSIYALATGFVIDFLKIKVCNDSYCIKIKHFSWFRKV